ncbi:SDR family NAD(P)-dependent oxidoreductase [Phytomonospora sp. NPDC050363]|uniref:SDR family NAD(P)-dependent oxidoreductase n=1 Tax=Phytomonospora sp. NPDC050363 TaxID=3155642 RepID=UPI0033EC6A33
MGSLDGRVALITGAGRGIGAALARYFAGEGAKVVVNDLGTAPDGSGIDASIAEAVARSITEAGGEAVADTGSVVDFGDARRMVAAAVEAFGDLHVVVNNAATEAGLGLVDLDEDTFDRVVDVGLKGTYAVSHWAARYWRDSAAPTVDRAIVNTASGSGLLNPLPTQTNYAASKAGIAAMTTVHALELGRMGVRVNCVSPSMVRTRLTEHVPGMPAPVTEGFDPTGPEVTAPLTAYLASADCPLTGQVLSVRGGTIALNRPWSLGPHVERHDRPWTVAELARELSGLDVGDPFADLAASLKGALGGADFGSRAAVQEMIDAVLAQARAAHAA